MSEGHLIMPERRLTDFMPRYETFDIGEFKVPFGIAISGMSQAGKSTLGREVQRSLGLLVPGIQVLAFPNSNGFRGVARDIVDREGLDENALIPSDMAASLVGQYLGLYTDIEYLVHLYESPKEGLRANAVNKIVAHIGDNPILNPLINDASCLFLDKLINTPGYAEKLSMSSPNAVLMDNRCASGEGYDKFRAARMTNAANFIVTCKEQVAIDRIPGTGAEPNHIRVENLRSRNKRDRDRTINPTSMPEDYDGAIAIEKELRANHVSALITAGEAAASNPEEVPLTIATDNLHPERISDGIIHVVSGALRVVKQARRKNLVAA